ncbi:MAG TPA: TIGR03885 family FMN-dependent LLM class oxidoreductase [Devosia sp.]|nr:TIGR03885 family FMN-dependent LLM class oxidoreductase [Devosia sp.]
MTKIGYHASHEQFAPSALLRWVQLAEKAGFDAAKSSDHIHPWSERQAQSGFAWSWLAAAMQATALPFGSITAPGYRYHPAIVAHAAATLGEMFPGRFWLALGSGEAINESITGEYWPDKPERNAKLRECVDIIRALFDGETVTHRGRVTVVEAKIWSRPEKPVPLYGAAVSPETAKFCGKWADGLLTVAGADTDSARKVIDAFREGGGEGKPIALQSALSWAPTDKEAEEEADHQWSSASIGGDAAWDLRRPQDFDTVAGKVPVEKMRQTIPIGSSLDFHLEWIGKLLELGPSELHLHQVGRDQEGFIETFGTRVLPQLRR